MGDVLKKTRVSPGGDCNVQLVLSGVQVVPFRGEPVHTPVGGLNNYPGPQHDSDRNPFSY